MGAWLDAPGDGVAVEVEVALRDGMVRPATLTPASTSDVRGGVVLLHGAQHGERGHPLYVCTAQVLAGSGLDVLAFDRREAEDILTLAQQTDDAHDMARALRDLTGLTAAPVGWWGWSQGAWVATLAAADDPSTFVFLIGYSVQNPAEQMRLYTRNLLEEAGHGPAALAELDVVRGAYEGHLRGVIAEDEAAAVILSHRERPWFDKAWVPEPPLPDAGVREWMVTLQPRSVLARLQCRVTGVWGDRDNVVDVEAGRTSLHELGPTAHAYVVDGADHGLSATGDQAPVTAYESLLADEVGWLLPEEPSRARPNL